MFTGIVEETGTVIRLRETNAAIAVTISCKKISEDLSVGDSIAVNGICLTVTAYGKDFFTADLMKETLDRTGGLRRGDPVNLERAVAAGGRFGGHFVTGHIDGIGKIQKITRGYRSTEYTVTADRSILDLVVEIGSVAVDGISLTVAKKGRHDFTVALIPHSLSATTLQEKKRGDNVNLETDIIGKYIKEFSRKSQGITEELLLQNGF